MQKFIFFLIIFSFAIILGLKAQAIPVSSDTSTFQVNDDSCFMNLKNKTVNSKEIEYYNFTEIIINPNRHLKVKIREIHSWGLKVTINRRMDSTQSTTSIIDEDQLNKDMKEETISKNVIRKIYTSNKILVDKIIEKIAGVEVQKAGKNYELNFLKIKNQNMNKNTQQNSFYRKINLYYIFTESQILGIQVVSTPFSNRHFLFSTSFNVSTIHKHNKSYTRLFSIGAGYEFKLGQGELSSLINYGMIYGYSKNKEELENIYRYDLILNSTISFPFNDTAFGFMLSIDYFPFETDVISFQEEYYIKAGFCIYVN